jgi:hypothetical protein
MYVKTILVSIFQQSDANSTTPPTTHQSARVVSYGPFSLCVIHKEGLCPKSGDINRMTKYLNCKANITSHIVFAVPICYKSTFSFQEDIFQCRQ